MTKFSLKFDSKIDDIGFSNAISIDELGDLLKAVFGVINAKKSDKVIMTNVVDNCYQIDINTTNNLFEARIINAGKSALEKSDFELNKNELRLKNSIAKSLKTGWYMEILNNKGISEVTVPYGFNEKTIEIYHSFKNLEGFITEIGDKNLEAKGLHIYLSDYSDFKIFINSEQHNELKKYYRTQVVKIKVQLNKSLSTNKILSAKLISFKPKDEKNFPDNLENFDLSDINIFYE